MNKKIITLLAFVFFIGQMQGAENARIASAMTRPNGEPQSAPARPANPNSACGCMTSQQQHPDEGLLREKLFNNARKAMDSDEKAFEYVERIARDGLLTRMAPLLIISCAVHHPLQACDLQQQAQQENGSEGSEGNDVYVRPIQERELNKRRINTEPKQVQEPKAPEQQYRLVTIAAACCVTGFLLYKILKK